MTTVLGVFRLDKNDFLAWSRKYDKDQGWRGQKERELGARFRKQKVMTHADLVQVVEWKFQDDEKKKLEVLELVTRNDEALVSRVSNKVFSLPVADDAYRMNCLLTLQGVSPVLASVILAFFDPRQYGVFDVYAWRALLGNEPPNLFSTINYVKLHSALRKTAAKHNLDVRTVEKALVKKKLEESGVSDNRSQRKRGRTSAKPKTRIKKQ